MIVFYRESIQVGRDRASVSVSVSVSVSAILTSLFWNRHYEVSKKVRHFKFGPVVQKLRAFKDTRIKKEKIRFRKTGSPLSFADISGVRCLTEFIRISKCSY